MNTLKNIKESGSGYTKIVDPTKSKFAFWVAVDEVGTELTNYSDFVDSDFDRISVSGNSHPPVIADNFDDAKKFAEQVVKRFPDCYVLVGQDKSSTKGSRSLGTATSVKAAYSPKYGEWIANDINESDDIVNNKVEEHDIIGNTEDEKCYTIDDTPSITTVKGLIDVLKKFNQNDKIEIVDDSGTPLDMTVFAVWNAAYERANADGEVRDGTTFIRYS